MAVTYDETWPRDTVLLRKTDLAARSLGGEPYASQTIGHRHD
jgi:hypothetical protein